jgi:hypothetical protein
MPSLTKRSDRRFPRRTRAQRNKRLERPGVQAGYLVPGAGVCRPLDRRSLGVKVET